MGALLLTLWLPSVACALDAQLPQPPYAADSFSFAGPTQPRRVEFALEPGGKLRRARLDVRLRNRTSLSGKISLRFFPVNGGAMIDLLDAKAAPRATVRLARADRNAVRLGARDYTLLRLAFRLPAEQELSSADGLLVAQLHARGEHGPVARLRIRAITSPLRFDPANVHLGVTRSYKGSHHDAATVVVRGRGARSLLYGPDVLGAAILRDGGASVRVRVEVDKARATPGQVVTRVVADDFDGVGHFSGNVRIDQAVRVKPLKIEIDVGYSFGVAVLVIFAGSLLGALFVRYTGVRRTARLLRLELQSALRRYDDLANSGDAASYRLDRWLDPREGGSPFATFPGTRGTAALLWNLRTARTTADIQQDAPRVRQVIGHIERLLTVEAVAREALRAVERKPVPRRDASFLNRPAYRETVEVLDEVRSAPTEGLHDDDLDPDDERAMRRRADDRAEDLVRRLADQTSVLNLAHVLWSLLAGFDGLSAADLPRARRQKVRALDLFREGSDEAAYWRHIETTELRVDLKSRIDRLREWWPEGHPLPGFETSEDAREVVEAAFRLESTAKNPEIVPIRRSPSLRAWLHFLQLQTSDWAWSLARAFVGVVVYALTLHDATWGSIEDFATAFTTGFVAETIVPWAALPAWQSIRNRVEKSGGGAQLESAETSPKSDAPVDPASTGQGPRPTPGGSGPAGDAPPGRPVPTEVTRGTDTVQVGGEVSDETTGVLQRLSASPAADDTACPSADELAQSMLDALGSCINSDALQWGGEPLLLLLGPGGDGLSVKTYVLQGASRLEQAAVVRDACREHLPLACGIVMPIAVVVDGKSTTSDQFVGLLMLDDTGGERAFMCEILRGADGRDVLVSAAGDDSMMWWGDVSTLLRESFSDSRLRRRESPAR
jgi:hypothetical protein